MSFKGNVVIGGDLKVRPFGRFAVKGGDILSVFVLEGDLDHHGDVVRGVVVEGGVDADEIDSLGLRGINLGLNLLNNNRFFELVAGVSDLLGKSFGIKPLLGILGGLGRFGRLGFVGG